MSRIAISLLAALSLHACMQPPGDPSEPSNQGGQGALATVQIGGVRWYADYDAAVELAREQDKALWVHFGENPG